MVADDILHAVEEAGLQPPLIKIPCNDIYGKLFYNYKNKWEDEDETK